MQELKGLGVAMVTPFQENGNVDFRRAGEARKAFA